MVVKKYQEQVQDDSAFMGIQSSAGASRFYEELLDYLGKNELRLPISLNSVIEDPSRSLNSKMTDSFGSRVEPRIFVGSSFDDPYERLAEAPKRLILGVRGFLTLNRLPDPSNKVVGDIAILASKVNYPSTATSTTVYISSRPESPSAELLDRLNSLGASIVSLDFGLEAVIQSVKNAELVISDGAAGLAIADGLGVLNVWHDSGISESEKFRVMDYLTGVDRASHLYIKTIPGESASIRRKARAADPGIINQQSERLIETLKKSVEYAPIELFSEPIELSATGTSASFPTGGASSGRLEFDYSYIGEKERRQVLVSFDFVKVNGGDFEQSEEIPKFSKSQRSEIGYYRYFSLEPGKGYKMLTYDLPNGIVCQGIKILKWIDSESVTEIDRMIHTKLR